MNSVPTFSSMLTIIVAILSLITMIVFFVMASRIGQIQKAIDYFHNLSMDDPLNWKEMKCPDCSKEFSVPKGKTNIYCPKCTSINAQPVEK